MSYGIRVVGNDSGGEFLEIDSSLGLINYVVTHFGTGSSVSISNIAGLDTLVFVKGPVGTNTIVCFGQSGSTITFKTPDGTAAGSSVSVSYMVCADVTGITPSGNYGIKVLTSGGATAFDSRNFLQNKGFTIVEYVEPATIDGSNSVISTDSSLYTEIGRWSYFNSSASGQANYAGVEYETTSIRHWDLEVDEELGPIYWDNYSTILVADVYP